MSASLQLSMGTLSKSARLSEPRFHRNSFHRNGDAVSITAFKPDCDNIWFDLNILKAGHTVPQIAFVAFS